MHCLLLPCQAEPSCTPSDHTSHCCHLKLGALFALWAHLIYTGYDISLVSNIPHFCLAILTAEVNPILAEARREKATGMTAAAVW